jgi:hypothetical protein
LGCTSAKASYLFANKAVAKPWIAADYQTGASDYCTNTVRALLLQSIPRGMYVPAPNTAVRAISSDGSMFIKLDDGSVTQCEDLYTDSNGYMTVTVTATAPGTRTLRLVGPGMEDTIYCGFANGHFTTAQHINKVQLFEPADPWWYSWNEIYNSSIQPTPVPAPLAGDATPLIDSNRIALSAHSLCPVGGIGGYFQNYYADLTMDSVITWVADSPTNATMTPGWQYRVGFWGRAEASEAAPRHTHSYSFVGEQASVSGIINSGTQGTESIAVALQDTMDYQSLDTDWTPLHTLSYTPQPLTQPLTSSPTDADYIIRLTAYADPPAEEGHTYEGWAQALCDIRATIPEKTESCPYIIEHVHTQSVF